jgi:putative SOS response-associated peptidase YedK
MMTKEREDSTLITEVKKGINEWLPIHTYTIITTLPNAVVSQYHDRMPVILEREDEGTWLNPDTEVDRLLPVLKPSPADEMAEWEVGAAERYPKNDYPEIIEPHKSSKQRTLF